MIFSFKSKKADFGKNPLKPAFFIGLHLNNEVFISLRQLIF